MATYNDEDVLIVLCQVFRHCEPLVGNTGKPAHSRLSRGGWETCREYVDLGVSGSTESRPELNPLMAKGRTVRVCWWRPCPTSSETTVKAKRPLAAVSGNSNERSRT